MRVMPPQLLSMTATLAILAGIFGLAVGSFLNVCIDRLPQGESIAGGRSHCDACKRQIRARDLVPVLSYVVLQGRCRDCGARIPIRVVLVEATAGIAFAALVLAYGLTVTSGVLAVYSAILIVVFVIDIEHRLILNTVVLCSLGFALLVAAFVQPQWLGDFGPHPFASAVAGAATGFILLFLVALIARGGMGWGDVKFAAFMGAATGLPLVLVALFCGVILGGVTGIALIVSGKKSRKQAIPFGPFLALGTMATLLWGPQMLSWYLGLM
jgi:leader peptidase (prepilin peptidase)/N-methyltransferase